MKNPNIKAVFFDLYDTLVYADRQKFQEKVNRCADLCHVRPEEFREVWHSLVVESNLGKFPRTEDRVREVLKILGVAQDPAVVEAVTTTEHEFLRSGIYLFKDALGTLAALQEAGLKLGLVTNASPSVEIVLSLGKLREYMQCTVISSQVGYRKPDSRIYRVALERLGSEPRQSVFVGDGNDRELEGAHNLGMTTILVKRDRAKYVQMKDSSAASVDFTVGMLEEAARVVLNDLTGQGA